MKAHLYVIVLSEVWLRLLLRIEAPSRKACCVDERHLYPFAILLRELQEERRWEIGILRSREISEMSTCYPTEF